MLKWNIKPWKVYPKSWTDSLRRVSCVSVYRNKRIISVYNRDVVVDVFENWGGNSLGAKLAIIWISMSKNQFCRQKLVSPKRESSSCLSDSHTKFSRSSLAIHVEKEETTKEIFVKCHSYLWLAPHLPLAPCLNPQRACYIYIVMRASLLTKHFLFDCTHKKQIVLSKIPRENSSSNLFCSSLDSW